MKKLISFLLSVTLCGSMLTIFPAASWDLDEQEAVEGDISSYVQVEEVTFGEPEPLAETLNEEDLYQLEMVGDFFEVEADSQEEQPAIQPMADLPDLSVRNLRINAGDMTSPYPAGYPMYYTFQLLNYGTADAENAEIIVKLDGEVATNPVPMGTVPAGKGGNIQFRGPAMSEGTHTMEIVVNPDKKIVESNYSNNSTKSTFTYESRVELVALSMETRDGDSQYYQDELVIFDMVFGNIGPISAANSEIALFGTFKTDDGRYVSSQMGETMTIPNLEPSVQVSAEVKLRFTKPTDNAEIKFVLDPNNRIMEFDKSNNSAAKTIEISGYVYKLSGGFFNTQNITYNMENISDNFYLNEINKALQMWSSRTDSFSITQTTEESNVDIILGNYGSVGWTAQSTVYGSWSGTYSKSLIEINADSCMKYGAEYVRPMIAHEMGHLLGLDHVLDKRCIMYAKEDAPTEGVQDAAKENPYLLERVAEDDIKGAEIACRNNLSKAMSADFSVKAPSKIMYTDQYDDMNTLLSNSDTVVIVEITDSKAEKIQGVVFTDYIVKVKDVLKNTKGYDLTEMKIRFTGGKMQADETNITETPSLEIGKLYLFAGHKTFSEDNTKQEFTPAGAYQGIFALEPTVKSHATIDNTQDYTIRSMNPYNAVEKKVEGTSLSKWGLDVLQREYEDTVPWTENTDLASTKAPSKVQYEPGYKSFFDQWKNSSTVLVAEVKGKEEVDNQRVVFTDYDVNIVDVLKNSNEYDLSNIKIRLLGGKTQFNQTISLESPVLEVGQTYLFVGEKVEPNSKNSQEFSPATAYKGIFRLVQTEQGDDYIFDSLNPHNAGFEEEVQGNLLSEIMQQVES